MSDTFNILFFFGVFVVISIVAVCIDKKVSIVKAIQTLVEGMI